jgi:hypothetical protein
VLFQIAESYRSIQESDNASTYYAQIVRDFPRSERVEDAKKRLVELKSPIPDPNPLALNRATSEQEGGGMFKWLFGGGKTVSTDTQAATMKGRSGELTADPAKE